MKLQYEDNSAKAFGLCLKSLRKEHHMSQENLEEAIKISRTTISKTERGLGLPQSDFVDRVFRIFKSYNLIEAYVSIQEDKKELISLAAKLYTHEPVIAKRIVKKVIKDALTANDVETVSMNVFQLMMWKLQSRKKVNHRKIDYIIKVFKELDSDKFADLLISLYGIADENGKDFNAYIKISDAIIDKIKLNNRKYSLILSKSASAYYYESDYVKAITLSTRAIETMKGEYFPHLADTIHRHGLISMQLDGYDTAIEYFKKCFKITDKLRLKRSSTVNTARAFYFNAFYFGKSYSDAEYHWRIFFEMVDKNAFNRVNALNDITMMWIIREQLDKASYTIKECERILKLAKEASWSMYKQESLLLRRNKTLLNAMRTNKFTTSEITGILDKLELSHLRDEFKLTKNFVLEKILSSSKI